MLKSKWAHAEEEAPTSAPAKQEAAPAAPAPAPPVSESLLRLSVHNYQYSHHPGCQCNLRRYLRRPLPGLVCPDRRHRRPLLRRRHHANFTARRRAK